MAQSAGISGLGVAAATAGSLLMYAGIRDVSLLDALRQVTGGSLPKGNADGKGAPAVAAAQAVLHGGGASAGTAVPAGGTAVAAGPGFPALAQAALRYKGLPYVWGATGPDSFDCSGLVQRAFADVGVKAPRTTYQQQPWRALAPITAAQASAGDLVFWPGHVAIVVAPGMVVHAPRPGKTVEVAPVGSAGPRGQSAVYKRYIGAKQTAPKSVMT